MNRFLTVFLTLALLSTPLADAEPEWHLRLEAEAVQAEGTSILEASLSFLALQFDAEAGKPPEDLGFTLDAFHLRVETDHANASTGPPVSQYHGAYTRSSEHRDARVLGAEVQDSYRLIVVPLEPENSPTVHASSPGCAEATPSHEARVTREPRMGLHESLDADTSKSIRWRACENSGSVTVEGDFLVVLWAWDAVLSEGGGPSNSLPSGRRPFDGTPPAIADARNVVGTADEQFLYARDATLTIPRFVGAHALYLHDGAWDAAAGFRLVGARGDVPGPHPRTLDGEDLRIGGEVQVLLNVEDAGGPLGVKASGNPEHLALDGVLLVAAAPRANTNSQWMFVAILAAVAAIASGTMWRRWAWRSSLDSPPGNGGDAHAAGRTSPVRRAPPRPPASLVRRDVEAEHRIRTVVERFPGIGIAETLRRVRVSKERAYAALDALVERGTLARYGGPGRQHLFVWGPGLDESWQGIVALQDADVAQLYAWVGEHPGARQRDVVAVARATWRWSESTTKDRLRRLLNAGLVRRDEAERGTLSARPAPSLQV